MIAQELRQIADGWQHIGPGPTIGRLRELADRIDAAAAQPDTTDLTTTEIRARALDAAVRWCSDHADVHAVADRFGAYIRDGSRP